jgi:hypothetical protein
MEYVRNAEQLRAQRSLQQNSSSLAVALPGTEHRALQARAQDKKLQAKLLRRAGQLQVALKRDAPLPVDSQQYKKGLAALRDEQLRKTQREIERDVALLGAITQERRQEGEASKRTRNQQNRAARKRKRIRQLVDSMAAWQRMDLPSSSIVQQLPQEWGEQVVLGLFKGNFPWRQGQDADVSTVLVEQFRDACAEVGMLLFAAIAWVLRLQRYDAKLVGKTFLNAVWMLLQSGDCNHLTTQWLCACACLCMSLSCCAQEARTLEELKMLQLERARIVAYYAFMQQQAAAAADAKDAAKKQQLAVVEQQMASGADLQQVAIGMKEQIMAAERAAAEQVVLMELSERFVRLKESAVARFS